MIKVCHLTSVHPVYDVRVFEKECVSLANAGYEVYWIVPNVDSRMERNIRIEGVNVNYQGRIKRIIKVTRKVFYRAVEINADIYHIHDPEMLPWALRLKRKGKVVIYDAHEDIVAQLLLKSWIPKCLRVFLSRVANVFLRSCLSKFDAVITVSPHIVDKLKQVSKNVVLITNYPILKEDEIIVDYSSKNICFPGLISSGWMHKNIIEAIYPLEEVKYMLAGSVDMAYLGELKSMRGWNKVEFLGKVPHNEVFNMYKRAAIGMALFDYTPNVGYKTGTLGNTKLFEYMQAGLPVICTDFDLWKMIVDDAKCGICVNPHNVDAIREAICYLLLNTDVAMEMGKNGKIAARTKYNWSVEEQKLIELYKSLSRIICDEKSSEQQIVNERKG